MKTFVSNAVKASVVATLLSAPLSAKTHATAYEDDEDFAAAPSAASHSDWTAKSNSTATVTTFEECAVPGVCRSVTVEGGRWTAVVTSKVSGKTVHVSMGQAFEIPVLYVKNGAIAAGIEYSITADVGQDSSDCFPQSQTVTLTPADAGKVITLEIPCT